MRTVVVPLTAAGLLFLIIFGTTISTTTVNSHGMYGSFNGLYFENANAPITGCSSPCLTVDTSKTSPGSSGSFSLGSSQVAYLWTPQYGGTSTAVPAGNIPIEIWASGTQTVSTLASDGVCSSTEYGTNTVACSLTTTSSPDTIIVFVEVSCTYGACATAPTVSSITAAGLTFNTRTSTSGTASVTSYIIEEYAVASSPLSALSISAAISSTSSDASMFAFGVSGAPSTGQFDGSAVKASGTGTAASVAISTTNTHDMVIGFVGGAMQSATSTPTATVGLGTTIPTAGGVTQSNRCHGSTYCTDVADGEYNDYSSTQTNLNVPFTLSNSMNWFMTADAIKAGLQPLGSLSLSLYYTDSSGGTQTLIGTGATSTLTTSNSEYTVTISASAFTIPASGYVELKVTAPSTSTYTVYWGTSQATNFQLTFSSGSV